MLNCAHDRNRDRYRTLERIRKAGHLKKPAASRTSVFTTGTGQFVADFAPLRQCCGVAVLSLHAHAAIKRVDPPRAKAAFTSELVEIPAKTKPARDIKRIGEASRSPRRRCWSMLSPTRRELVVEHIDMPLTSERVWRAVNAAKRVRADTHRSAS